MGEENAAFGCLLEAAMSETIDDGWIEIDVLNAIDRAREDNAVGRDALEELDDGDEEDPSGTGIGA